MRPTNTEAMRQSVEIKVGDYVASDDNEATMTVVALEGDRALCRWFVDGDVDGDELEAWIDLKALTVL